MTQGRKLIGGIQDETEPIETTFELNETLFAKAEIPPTEEVYLWLGVSLRGRSGPGYGGEG